MPAIEVIEGELINFSPFPSAAPGGQITPVNPNPYLSAPAPYEPYQVPRTAQPAPSNPFSDAPIPGANINRANGQTYWNPLSTDEVSPFTGKAYDDFSAIYDGMDELNAKIARDAAEAAAQAGKIGLGEALGAGLGGAFDAANTYAETGSISQSVGSGLGSTAGGIAGAALGSFLGPPGTFVGGILGSIAGEAIGQAIGKLLDPADVATNGPATSADLSPAFQGGQCDGVNYYCLGTSSYSIASNGEKFTTPASGRGTVGQGPLVRTSGVTSDGVAFDQIRGKNNELLLSATITGGSEGNTAQLVGIQVIRQDGLPDNCGNPKPTEPVTKPVDTKPGIRSPDYGNPRPFRPGLKLPNLPSSPSLPSPFPPVGPTGDPFGDPFGDPTLKPDPNPNPFPPPERNPFPPGDDPYKNPPSKEPPYQDPPKSDCDCNDPILELLRKLQKSIDELEPTDSTFEDVELEPVDCDDEQKITYSTLKLTFEHLSDQIRAIKTDVCEASPVAAIPEWWQVRAGANRPQLVTLYAEKLENGNYGRSRWPLTIPHYNGNPNPQLPPFTKGQWQGMLVLADNSKVIVYARSAAEAEKVIRACVPYIKPSQVPRPLTIYTGQRKGAALKQVKVYPRTAQYFPTGQENTVPQWVKKL